MPAEPTPEEKLLNIIKNQPGESSQENTASTGFSLLTDFPSIRSLKKSYLYPWTRILTQLNRIILGIAIGTAILWLYIGITRRPLLSSKPVRTSLFTSTPLLESPSSEHPKFEDLQTVFSSRNYFKNMGEPPPVIASQKVVSISDLVKSLNLSGIIEGEDPQAVIEDRSSGQVHYVKSGDYIGSMQVISVENNRVLLKYGDEETQLTL